MVGFRGGCGDRGLEVGKGWWWEVFVFRLRNLFYFVGYIELS